MAMSASAYDINALRATLTALVEEARAEVITNHERAGQVASGRTRASLRVEDESDAEGIEVTLWGRQFLQGLETGRRGGRVPAGFSGIIRQWSIDKGLAFASDRERNTFSYLVARKIAREGTALYRSGGRDDIYSPAFKTLTARVEQTLDAFFDGMINEMYDTTIENIKIN